MQKLLDQNHHHFRQKQDALKPKILYTTADVSSQSGAFRCLLEMSRDIAQYYYEPVLALHQDGLENSLLTTEHRQRTYFFDLPRAKRRRPMGYYLRYFAQNILSIYELVKFIQQEQVAIVHINEILDLYAGIAARIAGVPCVWHVRADLAAVPRVRWVLSRIVLALADKVIVVSSSVQERVFGERGKSKVIVIYDPGPDPTRFYPNIEGAVIREEFGIEREEPVVGLIGKLVEVKGHEALLRAAPHVLERFPDTHFLIVGGKVDGNHNVKYVSRLKNLLEELDIEDRVIFTGFRSDVPQIMAACDIVTHCSIYPDPFPGVVLQGMAIGKPVIASTLGGAKEQIEEGVSGLLVDPRDPCSLANAITSLLNSPEIRDSLGKTAAEQARARFTPEIFIDKLTALYNDLLETYE